MFTATAILWTVHKHGALTTLRGAGGTEKEFVKNIALFLARIVLFF